MRFRIGRMTPSEHERERNQMKNVLQQVLLVYALISHSYHHLPSFKHPKINGCNTKVVYLRLPDRR